MNIQSLQNNALLKPPATASQDDVKLKQACRDFEAIFLSYMLKKMRQTVSESKLIFGGRAEEIFRDMQDDEMSKEMSKSDGFGLSRMLFKELSGKAGLQKKEAR